MKKLPKTARNLADALNVAGYERWSEWVRIGRTAARARVKMVGDHDSNPIDNGENGEIIWLDRRPLGGVNTTQRPSHFDGSARKVHCRGGEGWWQPPKDCKTPEEIAGVFRYVQGFYDESWNYVGIVVERQSGPCGTCGERKETSGSLWGIESNSGKDFFAEVIWDLLGEAS